MKPRQPLSLQTRLLLGASLALVAFLGVTGVVLDRAFHESALSAMRDRLQSYVWAYLAGSDVSRGGDLILPEVPPEPRFGRPGSGLYAGVTGAKLKWESPSALGRQLPFQTRLQAGEQRFAGPLPTNVGGVYLFAQGVAWEVPGKGDIDLTFYVAEHESQIEGQVSVYRRTLAAWLGGLGVCLLFLQVAVLRWSAKPLRQLRSDLSAVEQGVSDRLPGHYPAELTGLATSLNDFIESEREHRTRYRNTLADLAHSLKTPLAVVRGQLEESRDDSALKTALVAQVRRMDEIVAYQLSRAATSGHQTFAAPLPVGESAEAVVRSLEKVYSDKKILCEFDLQAEARFYGEQGDLMELLGNLLENAFKWAGRRVLLSARALPEPGARRAGLEISIEDDGPGIADDQVPRLLQRGERGDEDVQGHGIGLAIVQDILKAYRGELRVGRSETLGGACFAVRFAPVR